MSFVQPNDLGDPGLEHLVDLLDHAALDDPVGGVRAQVVRLVEGGIEDERAGRSPGALPGAPRVLGLVAEERLAQRHRLAPLQDDHVRQQTRGRVDHQPVFLIFDGNFFEFHLEEAVVFCLLFSGWRARHVKSGCS